MSKILVILLIFITFEIANGRNHRRRQPTVTGEEEFDELASSNHRDHHHNQRSTLPKELSVKNSINPAKLVKLELTNGKKLKKIPTHEEHLKKTKSKVIPKLKKTIETTKLKEFPQKKINRADLGKTKDVGGKKTPQRKHVPIEDKKDPSLSIDIKKVQSEFIERENLLKRKLIKKLSKFASKCPGIKNILNDPILKITNTKKEIPNQQPNRPNPGNSHSRFSDETFEDSSELIYNTNGESGSIEEEDLSTESGRTVESDEDFRPNGVFYGSDELPRKTPLPSAEESWSIEEEYSSENSDSREGRSSVEFLKKQKIRNHSNRQRVYNSRKKVEDPSKRRWDVPDSDENRSDYIEERTLHTKESLIKAETKSDGAVGLTESIPEKEEVKSSQVQSSTPKKESPTVEKEILLEENKTSSLSKTEEKVNLVQVETILPKKSDNLTPSQDVTQNIPEKSLQNSEKESSSDEGKNNINENLTEIHPAKREEDEIKVVPVDQKVEAFDKKSEESVDIFDSDDKIKTENLTAKKEASPSVTEEPTENFSNEPENLPSKVNQRQSSDTVVDWVQSSNTTNDNVNATVLWSFLDSIIWESAPDADGHLVPICPTNEHMVMIPNPKSCQKYFYCLGGKPYEQECPHNLNYDPDKMRCGNPEDVQCFQATN